MPNLRDNRSRGNSNKKYAKRSFGEGRFGARDGEKSVLHTATCSACGMECRVPFKPNGEKPVYCNQCFKKEDTGTSRPSMGAMKKPSYSTGGSSAPMTSDQFKILNTKLDRILAALE